MEDGSRVVEGEVDQPKLAGLISNFCLSVPPKSRLA